MLNYVLLLLLISIHEVPSIHMPRDPAVGQICVLVVQRTCSTHYFLLSLRIIFYPVGFVRGQTGSPSLGPSFSLLHPAAWKGCLLFFLAIFFFSCN